MKVFDYIFYRVKEYYHRKNDLNPQLMGVLIVSQIQLFAIFDIFVILEIFGLFTFPDGFNKSWAILPTIFVNYFNWKKYGKKDFTSMKWNEEEINIKTKRGFAIIIVFFLLIAIPIVTGIIKHNIIEGRGFMGY